MTYKSNQLKFNQINKFKDKYKIKFDLLADENKEVLKKYKVWGKKKFMGREFMGIIPFYIYHEMVFQKDNVQTHKRLQIF